MNDLVPSESDRVMAAVAHACAVAGFGGWGPLLMVLLFKDQPFVRYHAMQAAVFQLGFTVVVIPMALCTFGLATVLLIPWMLFELWLAIEAYQGRWTGYPGMAHLFRD